MLKPELPKTDAIVVGSGPNGLAAAIRLAQAGWSVVVLEAAETPGGGVRSAELTLPGFVHDICSSVYPMVACSPFLSKLPLSQHGLEWVFPAAAAAHPFDDGTAALLHKSMSDTAAGLGRDGPGYDSLIGGLVEQWEELFSAALAPMIPIQKPLLMAGFGLGAMRSVRMIARAYFRTERARGFFAGVGAHSMVPLETLTSAASALLLMTAAHAAGWPFAHGGSQKLTDALVSYLKSLGGQVITQWRVDSLDELPKVKAVLLDVTPQQLLKIGGSKLPERYRRKLQKFRYGMGSFKLDWALSEPVPWTARECSLAGTVHIGGTLDEISDSERRTWRGEVSERPYVLFTQPTLFDPTRAPAGRHTAWAYCHVPNGFRGNLVDTVEAQVSRFAPGFRDCILARSVMGPQELEQHNPNLIGGDIGGGAVTPRQLFFRPTASFYRTPLEGIYLCSSSTPPAPGVHGMCGYFAAQTALARG
ncbi:MAG TPA: NAD(P)/FAD-dependent oxidoreductase [Candidatus Angelobacter sp.]|nr:NAD(P)/FAD-dependent oxidoreductase [Candidatus Angelobacter sp.]